MVIEIGKIPEGERLWNSQAVFTEDFTEKFLSGKKIPLSVITQRELSKISCFVKYETEVACECSRCLEEFQYEIKNEVRFFIVHENELHGDEEFDFYFYKNGNEKINFAQTIYDDIMTQIPMKPLCKENCKGIELRRYEEKSGNEQWDALKKLLK
jgi:uncharacterized metal-binding protein YceD (DUF177 family)